MSQYQTLGWCSSVYFLIVARAEALYPFPETVLTALIQVSAKLL